MKALYTEKKSDSFGQKPTKSVGHFEENKFSAGGHQFLLDSCPKLIKTYNLGQIADNKRQMINENGQQDCLFSKRLKVFVNSLSATVGFFTV